MGSDETATATTGGPRVIDVFDGNGAPSGPNCTLLWWQIGSWRPPEVGLVVGKRLHRIRHRCRGLVLSESPGSQTSAKPAIDAWAMREIGQKCLKRRRMRCRRLHVYSTDPMRPRGDLRTTNQQDSAGAAAMVVASSMSRIKKIFFSPPSTCLIDLFGPLAD